MRENKFIWANALELAVIIIILTILWTLAFISLKDYTKGYKPYMHNKEIEAKRHNEDIEMSIKWKGYICSPI